MLKPCCGVLPLVVMVCSVGIAKPGPAQEPAKTSAQEDVERIADLVLANHILVNQGVLDAFGHISVRSAKNPNHYFISRSRAPALVSADDIMEYDLEDHPIDARGRASYMERFIHSEIYKARPDVQSVVHSHSAGVIPFGVSDVPLQPISHMSGFLVRAVPVFEIREAGGDETDMLIEVQPLDAKIAGLRWIEGESSGCVRGPCTVMLRVLPEGASSFRPSASGVGQPQH